MPFDRKATQGYKKRVKAGSSRASYSVRRRLHGEKVRDGVSEFDLYPPSPGLWRDSQPWMWVARLSRRGLGEGGWVEAF